MNSKAGNIIEKTGALSVAELETLVTESVYILGVTIISQMEPEVAGFEGGDTWIIDQYRMSIDQQFLPTRDEGSWTNTTLSMSGVKETSKDIDRLQIGGRYIVFYDYSAMANGYSLEGLMRWSDDKVAAIEQIIKRK